MLYYIKKYFRLYRKLFQVNLMKDMMYRFNFWLSSSLVMLESIIVAVVVTVIFAHIDTIAGWSYHDMLILSGVFMLTHSFAWLFYKSGTNDLDKLIKRGDLDWYLVKPVDPQALLAWHRIDIEDAGRGVVGIIIMIFGMMGNTNVSLFPGIPLFLILFLAGQLLLYSITLIVKTISFTSIDGWATNAISYRFHNLAKYPTDIYQGALRIIFTFLFPLLFLATVPVKALTGTLTLHLFLGAMFTGLCSTYLARKVWLYALSKYSSASS